MTAALSWELVDRTAETLGASAVARRKWRQTGRHVPPKWRIRIAEALAQSGTPVAVGAFDDLPPRPGSLASGEQA